MPHGIPDTLTTVVAARDMLADGVVRLTLHRPDGADLPPWTPGAHIDLHLRPGLVRPYSLCGDPDRRDTWQVAVLREPAGRGGSRHVHDELLTGHTVEVAGPRNNFPLVPASGYLFVAGGIGITPLLPMVAVVARAGLPWRLVYGGRQRASMAFLDVLAAYGDAVQVRPQDEYGLLDTVGLAATVGDGTAVYCCGPEGLLGAMETACAGLPPGALHVERFTAAPIDTAGDTAFEVELARSGLVLRVEPGQSILEAAEAASVPVMSSCREGTCGTCETPVLAGIVDHRDSLLSAAERESSGLMMPCVSRAAAGSPRLVLDL